MTHGEMSTQMFIKEKRSDDYSQEFTLKKTQQSLLLTLDKINTSCRNLGNAWDDSL